MTKAIKIPVNGSRIASAIGVKAARAAVRTHAGVTRPASRMAQALARALHPHK
jgi:hypothetical protein